MIDFFERPGSPSSTGKSFLKVYGAAGVSSETEVRNHAVAATPDIVASPELGLLYRNDIAIKSEGWHLYGVEISYGRLPSLKGQSKGELKLNFDTTGGTVVLSTSRGTKIHSANGHYPDHRGAINVKGDEIRGVPITIPILKISVQVDHPRGVIGLPRIKGLAYNTGRVNSKPFLTFAPGEALFLGAQGTDSINSGASANYHFGMSMNEEDLSIGQMANIAKAGHDYVWIKFEDVISDVTLAKRPVQAYVEKVYRTADLAAILGFG